MLDKVVAFVARHAGKQRSITIRIVSIVCGLVLFLVVAPVILGAVGHLIAQSIAITVPRNVEALLGAAGAIVGLFFLFWSISAFWLIGKGTPVPFASPTRLVTSGPFRYTRNPIKLGANLFYFGIGTICDQFVTGLIMLIIGLVLGTVYHKSVEEKELLIRFGNEYEEYRERTSFFIPMPPRTRKVS